MKTIDPVSTSGQNDELFGGLQSNNNNKTDLEMFSPRGLKQLNEKT